MANDSSADSSPGPSTVEQRVSHLEEFSARDAYDLHELRGRVATIEQQHAAEGDAESTVGVVLRGLLVTALSAGVWSLIDHLVTRRMDRPGRGQQKPPERAPEAPALVSPEFPSP